MTAPDLTALTNSPITLAITTMMATVLAVGTCVVMYRRLRQPDTGTTPEDAQADGTEGPQRRKFSAGTVAAAIAFVVCTSVSLNTSYRFTADGLGMTGDLERILSCAAFESLLAMCVLGARERLAGPNRSPGWYGGAVWAFAGLSAVPAWHEGGGFTTATIVRVIVGSFGAALSAHAALGLELKHRSGDESQAPTALVLRDLRERLMARLGLAHRARTAQDIARGRALDKAVDLADRYYRLSDEDRGKSKGAKIAKRLAATQDRAEIATNEDQRQLYRARVAQRRYATELDITAAESPWHISGTSEEHARAVETLEQHTRHMEALAAEAEAALAAQIGTPPPAHSGAPAPALPIEAHASTDDCTEALTAAAAQIGTSTVTARVPKQHGEDQEHAQDEEPQSLRHLRSYPTKRAALEALYAARITADDQRSTNAITEALLVDLAEAGITLSRPTAHRYVSDLRPTAHDSHRTETPAHEGAKAAELVNA